MNNLLDVIGDALDFLRNNIFFLIIILNVISRFFKQSKETETETETETEIATQAEAEDLWSDPQEAHFRSDNSLDASGDVGAMSRRYGDHDAKSEEQLTELTRDYIDMALDTRRENDQLLNAITNTLTRHPVLGDLVPALARVHEDLNHLYSIFKKQLQSVERAYSERVTSEVLKRAQEVSDQGGVIAENADLILRLTDLLTADLERFELAQRITKDQIDPLARYRHAQGIDLKRYPLIMPKSSRHLVRQISERVSGYFNFLISDYDALDDVATWPLKSRSTVQILDKIAPRWSQEWRSLKGNVRRPLLPRRAETGLTWDLNESLNYWGDQLFNMHFMALRYGPAALRAILIECGQHDDIKSLSTLRAESNRRRHVPQRAPQLFEVEVVIATLSKMGFSREVDMIARPWRKHIGAEIKVQTSDGSSGLFPYVEIERAVSQWCATLYQHEWSVWDQTEVLGIPGLVCTRGTWSLTREHSQQIAEGQHLASVPDHIHWLTVINVAQQLPQYIAHAHRLTERYLRHHHHLNTNTGKKHAQSHEVISRADIIAALALSDLFDRSRVSLPKKRWRRSG